jgi:hypothetical protein
MFSIRLLAMTACLLGLLLLPAAANAVTVSGTAMKDELGNSWQGCDGVTPNIKVVVGTTAAGTTTCNPTTGVFSLTGVTIPSIGSRVVVFYDGALAKGVLYTTAASTSANITGLTPTQDRVWIRSEQATPSLDWHLVNGYASTQDADIPVTDDGSSLVLAAGTELHVDSPVTFALDDGAGGQRGVDAASIHVETGATYAPADWTDTVVHGNGTLGCTNGPNVARPMCVEAGATIPSNYSTLSYADQTGQYTIEPGSWFAVNTWGTKSSLGIIGYASGQTLAMSGDFGVHSKITSDPWGADVSFYYGYMDGNAQNGGVYTNPSWTGSSTFAITSLGGFDGGGTVNLPGANFTLSSQQARVDFGPRDGQEVAVDWDFRSIKLRNGGYQRQPWGVGTTGTTTAVNSPTGTPADTPIDIVHSWCGTWALYQLGQNSGDWGIVRYNDDGSADFDWDDGDVNTTDNDGNALLLFSTAGADVPWAIDEDGCKIVAVGSSAGNWMVRKYDGDGALDTTFNGTGWRSDDFSGTDEARGVVFTGGSVAVAGTGAATPAWKVRVYNSNGTVSNTLTWAPAGGAEVRGFCRNDDWGGALYVVGRTGAAGSRDWAARRLTWDWSAWDTFNGAATWTWNPGGTEDEAIDCSAQGDFLFVAGTTGTGASDDIRVRAFYDDGTPYTDWAGGTGIVSINNAGDDEVGSIINDRWADNIIVAGKNGATSQATMWRYDADGEPDTTWGAGGVTGGTGIISWADETASALFMDDSSNVYVGTRVASNGGDGAIRRYDYNGDLTTATAAGTTRVLMRNAWDGKSRLTAEDSFTVGNSADAGSTMLDLESYDGRVESKNLLTVQSTRGQLRASSTRPLVSRNDMLLLGTFWPNLGEVRLESQTFRSELHVGTTTQLHNLSVVGGNKMVAFDEANRIRINGTFYARGTSCTDPIELKSVVGGNAWDLDLTGGGTVDVQYAQISDGNALSAVTATNSRDNGGNTNWTISGCAGTAYLAPNGFQVDGLSHPVNSNTAPLLSWFNRVGSTADRADVEVYSSPPNNQVALWRLDGSGADAAGSWTLTPSAGSSWPTGKFSQAIDSSTTYGGLNGGDLDLLGDFTIDGWVKTTLPGSYEWPDVVYKGNGTGTLVNYRIGFQKSANELQAELTVNGGASWAQVYVPASPVIDGNWHHIAMTYYNNNRLSLYIDGELAGADSTGTTAATDNVAAGVVLGYQLGGQLDDWRVTSEAAGPADIRGYYRTGRRHYDLIWDADPGNSAGYALTSCGTYGSTTAPPCGNNARANVTYGGSAGDLRLDGARYWARMRTRSTGLQWSNWSDYDYWDVDQSMTASVTTGTTVALGGGAATLPGTDVSGTATFQVTTTNVHGYTAYAYGPSDTWAMSDGLSGATHVIPGRGAVNSPTAWPAGTSGYFGLSVLAATGSKDTARWGTGTTATDYANLNWGWGGTSTGLMLNTRSAYDPAAQNIDLAVRANPPATADPGQYTTTLVLTAVPNV